MAKIATSSFDFREMFDIAKEFSDTASRAAGKSSIEQQGWMRPGVIPEIVNRAFSCEVFLKSLLVYSDVQFQKEHELDALWKLIPYNLQEEIKQEVSKRIEFEDDNGFDDLLARCSNAFASWRYIYEYGALSGFPGFLKAFSDSMREICCQKYHNCSWNDYEKLS